MSSPATVQIWPSQFPDQLRRDLLESLESRQINHKFHYDSVKQTQKWLELHQAISPSRKDPDCAAIYEAAFHEAARRLDDHSIHLVGLGCGGGQKDTRFLSILKQPGRELFYTPSDVSTAMVLVARKTAVGVVPVQNCLPSVCDLSSEANLATVFQTKGVGVYTFFGMIPNFEPDTIVPKLSSLLKPDEFLLFSANLAPGEDYETGVQKILPQYDNALTSDWLLTFLLDLGVEREDGELRFAIEPDSSGHGLKRVVARFWFRRTRRIKLGSDELMFQNGETIRLFFSYRYTPALLETLMCKNGLEIEGSWITRSGEEGVFLLKKMRV